MKVLLMVTDLYRSIGGGQTVYKKIIESAADIDFYYFINSECLDAQRPPNAHPMLLQPRRQLRVLVPPPYPFFRKVSLEEADQYARSVTGQRFDLVDMPDYYNYGALLRSAFSHHGVSVGQIILAMHGNISDSIELNWGSAQDNVLEQRALELDQFKVADFVYGISKRYIQEWQDRYMRPVTWIDPSYFVNAVFQEAPTARADIPPSLYCIGRSERRKGNDLFIELVAWLSKGSFGSAAHIGDADYSYQGISSSYLLDNIAKARGVEVESRSAFNRKEMLKIYSERSIVVLPVRYDTLNLVALEALFSGCPVAVSDKAGVCDYLDVNYPGLPYIKINFDRFYDAVTQLQLLVDNYDLHRQLLAQYLASKADKRNESFAMRSIYRQLVDNPPAIIDEQVMPAIPYEKQWRLREDWLAKLMRVRLTIKTYRAVVRRIIRAPKLFVIESLRRSKFPPKLVCMRSLEKRMIFLGD